jgi:predicted transcriptional regulator
MFDSQSEEAAYGSIAFLDGAPASAHSTERPRRPSGPGRRVAPADPAVKVMTDFSAEPAVAVSPDRLIDDALRDMIVAGVRALLVARGEVIVGLITSYDIQGERPLQFLRTSGFTRHDEIQVEHIMTPWEEVPTLDTQWVSSARVGDVVHHFKSRQASHLLVVEYGKRSGVLVRGLFSRTQLERQLGQSIW